MYLISGLDAFPELIHASSERKEGNMSFRWEPREKVFPNRIAFLSQLAVPLEHCVGTSLEHKTEVTRVHAEDGGKGMSNTEGALAGDAFLTNARNTFLFLLTGDCLPVLFYDPVREAVGIAHASRHNTPQFLVKKVL